MKKLLTTLLILFSLASQAQTYKYVTIPGETGYVRGALRVDGNIWLGYDTLPVPLSLQGYPAIAGRGDSLYRYSPVQHKWIPLSGGGGAVTWGSITGNMDAQLDLVARFNLKQNKLLQGTTGQYFRGDLSLGNFSSDVLGITGTRLLPAGGTTGQVLIKTSGSDYAVNWQTKTDKYLVSGSVVGAKYKSIYGEYNDGTSMLIGTFQDLMDTSEVVAVDTLYKSGIDLAYRIAGRTYTLPNIFNDGIGFNVNPDNFKVTPPGSFVGDKYNLDLSDAILAKINEVTTPGNFVTYPDFNDSLRAHWSAIMQRYTAAQSNARFYPLASNPAGYLTRDSLGSIGTGTGETYNSNDTLTENRLVYLNDQSVTFMNDPASVGVYYNATAIGADHFQANYKNTTNGTEAYSLTSDQIVELYSGAENTDKYSRLNMTGGEITLETTDQTATGVHNSIYMSGDGTMLFNNDAGRYYFSSLGPAGVGYNKVLIAKDTTTSTGISAVKMAYKDITELGADGNNYVSGASLSGGTLTLNRNGLPDITVSGFNAGAGTVTGGQINFPGAIFNTPTTGTVTSGSLNFSPTLAPQAANYALMGPLSGSDAAPSFRRPALPDIATTSANGVPYSWNGGLMVSDSFKRVNQSLVLWGDQAGQVSTAIRNFNPAGYAAINLVNDGAFSSNVLMAGTNYSDLRQRNRMVFNSQTGFSFFPYNLSTAGQQPPSYADYRFYSGTTGGGAPLGGSSSKPMVTFTANGHVLIGDTTNDADPYPYLKVHKIIADSLIVGGVGSGTSGGTGGTSYTDANARAAISLTTTGSSGAATYNSSTGVLNIPQYTGGTGSGLAPSTSAIYANGNSYNIPASNPTVTPIELYNIGNVLGATDARLALKTGIGKVQYAMATTFNLNWNTTTNKWTQDNASYPSMWTEHGTEGITFHAVPAGTSNIYSGIIHENFQVRNAGVDGTSGLTTGQYNQSKVPLYFKYDNSAIVDDTHPGNFNQLGGTNGNAPFIWMHAETGKGTEIEFQRMEMNSATSTGGINYYRKSRGTYAAKTASLSGDYAGLFSFSQYDGAAYQNTARIAALMEATATAGVAPQSFVIQTSPTNSAGILTRLTVKSTGTVALNAYGTGAKTGTAAYGLGVDASGNIVETATSAGGGTSISTSAATTLTLATATETYVFTGASATTWTLPAVSGNTAKRFFIKNRGTANITLQRAGTDQIYLATAVTSMVIAPGEGYTIQNDGTYWLVL